MTVLPSRGWPSYLAAIKSLGERRPHASADDLLFLRAIGLVERVPAPVLSELGQAFFRAEFVQEDTGQARQVLSTAILTYPPALALTQLFAGVASASRPAAESLLRNQGFGDGLTQRSLGTLLTLMHSAGVIDYNARQGTFRVLVHLADQAAPPSSVFISPQTPFGNRVWLRRVLQENSGYLYWLDKHFTSAAFESLWEAIDGSVLSAVRILSLYLPDYHGGRKVKRDYADLQRELSGRGVSFEWRVIDSVAIRDTHDRWLISATAARNIPNTNAIFSGQHSELNKSTQRDELEALFESYWTTATPIAQRWQP